MLLLCSSFSLTTSTLIRAYGLQFCRRSKQDFCPGGRGNGEWMRSWCEDRTSDWLLSYGEVWIAQGEGFGCESLDRGVSMLEYYPTFYLCFSASIYVIKLRAFLYIIILMIYFVRHAESIYNDA